MTANLLVSTALMAVLVVMIAIALARSRQWYSYDQSATGAAEEDWARRRPENPSLLQRPGTWVAGFVLLLLATVGGVFAFVTNPDAPGSLTSGPILAGAGLLVVVYLLAGTYYGAKERGHPQSLAAAETITVVAVLFLLGVSAQLIG